MAIATRSKLCPQDYDYDFVNGPKIPLYALKPRKSKKSKQKFTYDDILCDDSNRPSKCQIELRYLTRIQIANQLENAAEYAQCPNGFASSSMVIDGSGPSLIPSEQFPTERQPSSEMDAYIKDNQEQVIKDNQEQRNVSVDDPINLPQAIISDNLARGIYPQEMGQQFPMNQLNPMQQQLSFNQLGGGTYVNQQPRNAIVDGKMNFQHAPFCEYSARGIAQPMDQQGSWSQQNPMQQHQRNFNQSGVGPYNQQLLPSFDQTTHPEEVTKNLALPYSKPDPSFMQGFTLLPKPEPQWPPRSCPPNMHILQQPSEPIDMQPQADYSAPQQEASSKHFIDGGSKTSQVSWGPDVKLKKCCQRH